MKKINIFISILLLAILPYTAFSQQTVTILHLNDTHSTLAPLGPRNASLEGSQGGVARAASIIGLTKMMEPNVLTLHAGDIFIGDLFFNKYFGAAELSLMKEIGFDAMTVGNHEFDLTPEALLGSLAESFDPGEGFPLLSANADLSALTSPPLSNLYYYIFPNTVKDFGTVKVGIFGLTTPAAMLLSQPSPIVISEDIINIAVNQITDLTTQGCDVIILLSHLGVDLDKLIAENIPGIDIIIGGHDHYKYEAPLPIPNPGGGTTWVAQAGSNYMYIGKMKLDIDTDGKVALSDYALIPLDENVLEEPTVKAMVDGMISDIETFYDTPFFTQPFGYANAFHEEEATDLLRLGAHDTPIGNLAADAFKNLTGTQIAIHAGGSTALPIWEGTFNMADIFRVNGYGFNTVNTLGFQLATFKMTGEALWMGLEFGLSEIEKNDEFFIQVSGLEYKYDATKPVWERVVSVTVNGNIINPNAKYSVTASELVLTLLNYLGIPYSNPNILVGVTEFEALAAYVLTLNNFLHPKEIGRVVNVGSGEAANHININGYFNSDAGYYLPDLSTSGQFSLNINIKEKYPNVFQADNVQMKFPEANLVFNGSEVEYLLVDQNFITIRGKGKIIGDGDYEYLITAYDGGVIPNDDKIKVALWEKSNEEIIYSNPVLTSLNEGAIVVHKSVFAKNGTESLQPEVYILEQNYPNPFNPTTKISFSIPEAGLVQLKVYNLLGEEVATLVSEEKLPGRYEVVFDANNLSSGVYLYTIKAGNFAESKKMIIMK
ncbi:MAG: 5'-nucleotidase C-terminal domain-containing protein [Ignavibacteriaceae bacterium]|nr:5'-nucleotidase C-terminal domain-containing protein [Ignavibacteriaceae bacterium]